MTQTTDPGRDSWRASWATPSPAEGQTEAPADQPEPEPPTGYQPAPGYEASYPPPAQPPEPVAYPPSPQPGYPPAAQPGYPPAAQPGYPPTAQSTIPSPDRPDVLSAFLPNDQGAYQPGPPAGGFGGAAPYSSDPTQPISDADSVWHSPPPPPTGPFSSSPPRREPRRPGWGGVVAVGAGAAVLSSLLTAGALSVRDTTSNTSATTFSSGSGSTSSSTAVTAPVSGSSATAPAWGAVASAVKPSVVAVLVEGQTTSGQGSGIILDTKGDVLTNNHVVADVATGGSLTVVLNDSRVLAAKIVGTDASTDLAVIRIQNPPGDLKPASLGNSKGVKVGDGVMAIGNPLGLSETATTGIVSATNRPVTTSAADTQLNGSGNSENVYTNAIQTDAAVNPGNSGGALVDSQGLVVGITSSIASLGSSMGSQSGSIGLGFAIPINEAKDVASALLTKGVVQHAWLGIALSDGTATLDGTRRQAAVLGTVTSGGPAAKAGLQAKDAVIAIDGDGVTGSDAFIAQIRERRPGTKATVTVVRNGKSTNLVVTLGVRPATNN